MELPTRRTVLPGPWTINKICRRCGRRERGEVSRLDNFCAGCGEFGRWGWDLWDEVVERREGFLRRRWVRRTDAA
jgi:hypothetical protein